MDSAASIPDDPSKATQIYRRPRRQRRRQLTLRFTEDEYQLLTTAAREAGWTVGGWAAASGVAASKQLLAET